MLKNDGGGNEEEKYNKSKSLPKDFLLPGHAAVKYAGHIVRVRVGGLWKKHRHQGRLWASMMLEIAPEMTFGVLSRIWGCECNFTLQIYANGCNFLHNGLCELQDWL